MDVKKILLAIVNAVLLSACLVPSGLADDQGAVKSICAAPLVVLGAVTGIVVGTPLAIVRLSRKDIKGIFHAYDSDTFSWKFWGRPAALPVGIMTGTIKGCIVGPKNAIRYTKEKPYSKDVFSLEDLK